MSPTTERKNETQSNRGRQVPACRRVVHPRHSGCLAGWRPSSASLVGRLVAGYHFRGYSRLGDRPTGKQIERGHYSIVVASSFHTAWIGRKITALVASISMCVHIDPLVSLTALGRCCSLSRHIAYHVVARGVLCPHTELTLAQGILGKYLL